MSPAPVNVSENPTFKLIYFDVKGLSEPIRYLFAYGGQKYEDVRVKDEDWTTLKPSKHHKYQSRKIVRFKSVFVQLL